MINNQVTIVETRYITKILVIKYASFLRILCSNNIHISLPHFDNKMTRIKDSL